MVLSIWHFTAKSHVDVKHVYSQFGNIVSDTTTCKALNSMTGSSLAILQASIKAATEQGETEWCIVLDNVQEYCPVYEGGISCQSILKVRTTATTIHLDDYKPLVLSTCRSSCMCRSEKMEDYDCWNSQDWHQLDSRTQCSIATLGSCSCQLHPTTQAYVQGDFS